MIFDLKFFLILSISGIIYWLIPKQNIRNIFLLIISFLFIYYHDKYASLVVILLSIYTYSFAHLIEIKTNNKIIHKIGIAGIILLLIIFKYLGFLENTFNKLYEFFGQLPLIKVDKILLPLGLSYIVLKYISYLTDIYWKIINKNSFLNFLLYGSFFAIYTAGPIERFERFSKQIESINLNFKTEYITQSFERIVYGLFKKLVIADWIGYYINPIWQNPVNFNIEIKSLALIAYSFQIYMDFSGYSDIAIGASNIFGIKIMENFNYPYLKSNISQFWRSWHISLSDWIRDYLFFPLSRISNKKIWIYFLVPVITMCICGLWHSASWHFILWGAWHGIGLTIYQLWFKYKKKNKINKSDNKLSYSLGVIITFVFVTFGWLFFI